MSHHDVKPQSRDVIGRPSLVVIRGLGCQIEAVCHCYDVISESCDTGLDSCQMARDGLTFIGSYRPDPYTFCHMVPIPLAPISLLSGLRVEGDQ